MKKLFTVSLLFVSVISFSQDPKISTIDFVQVLNDNRDETIYYYENNWLILRKQAVERGYIEYYEIIEVEPTDDAPFHLILKTTYANRSDFDMAEENFQKLIDEKGPRRLLNEKQPGDFRKILFSKVDGVHLF